MSPDNKDLDNPKAYKTLPESNPFSKVSGILPDRALREFIKAGVIGIEPTIYDLEERVKGVSIDFTLGNTLKFFRSDGDKKIDLKNSPPKDIEKMMETKTFKTGEILILKPNTFAIATTKEKLTLPLDIIGHLKGRRSLTELGIIVHSTDARFDPGWDGYPRIVFSTFPNRETFLYPGQTLICAFSFERLKIPVEKGYSKKAKTTRLSCGWMK